MGVDVVLWAENTKEYVEVLLDKIKEYSGKKW